MIVKKYGNRRLYDTSDSRAKTGEDLTAPTLTQILIEGRGAARLLPVPMLIQLVRLGDDALAEFFGQYLRWALDVYLNARQGVRQIAPYNPLAMAPFGATEALLRLFGGSSARSEPPPLATTVSGSNEIAELRRELQEMKRSLRKRRR